ncbi:MAG: VWA-like domain-containing protein [Actinomycetota bacterium]
MSQSEPAATADPTPSAALDAQRVAAARLWASTTHPYLASALFAASVVPAPGSGAVRIDRWWRVHADPDVVAVSRAQDLGGELVHLVGHVLRDHASRADALALGDADEISHWGAAADAELADDFVDLPRLRTETTTPHDLACPEGRLAEEYYRRGMVDADTVHDCGSGAHGHPDPSDLPPPSTDDDNDGAASSGLDADAQELIRHRVTREIAAAEPGTVGAGLRRWADERRAPVVDWRTALGAVIRRSLSGAAGAVDYSYRRPSRRASVSSGLVLASMVQPTIEVAIVIDTSASVDDGELGLALAEVDGVLRATGTRTARVLACDTEVRSVARVSTSAADVELVGGGGTDLVAGLNAASSLRPAPDVIIALTDGYTPWPDSPMRATVVVGRFPQREGLPPPPPAPGWAQIVDLAGVDVEGAAAP